MCQGLRQHIQDIKSPHPIFSPLFKKFLFSGSIILCIETFWNSWDSFTRNWNLYIKSFNLGCMWWSCLFNIKQSIGSWNRVAKGGTQRKPCIFAYLEMRIPIFFPYFVQSFLFFECYLSLDTLHIPLHALHAYDARLLSCRTFTYFNAICSILDQSTVFILMFAFI